MEPNILAEKFIKPEIEPEKEDEEKQYEHVLKEKDKSNQASVLSPQMAKVIWWNVPRLNQQKAHRLFKKITEHFDILTRNENREAVVNRNASFVSYFKSLFKSMVSNQQNLNQADIDKFLRS